MPPGLATFLAEVIAFTCRELAKNADVIVPALISAWRKATVQTMTDAAKVPQGYMDAINKEIADATRP